MNKQWVEGIVFKRQSFQETDVLVRIFTQEYGLFTMIVKGAKRPKSKLNSSVLNFSYGHYLVDIKPNRISRLNTTTKVKQFESIITDIEKSAYATFLCDLANRAFVDYQAEGEYYQLLKQALLRLDEGKNPEIVMQIFQLKMLKAYGVAPELRHCVVCQNTEGEFAYSLEKGGIICQKHLSEFSNLRLLDLSTKEVSLLRTLAFVPLDKLNHVTVKHQTQTRLSKAIDRIYLETLDMTLKSKQYLNQMTTWLID
ncbi:DNA repair protein RecO [Holzapfeliella sp. He02]|uniref:DNA repair protein RecO n=1 Tax=Holzapfeliella saturejae TaxID=3082953 RepID=A0ABU8SGN3_9LACO